MSGNRTHPCLCARCDTAPVAPAKPRIDVEAKAALIHEPCRDFDPPSSCYLNDGTGLWCEPCVARDSLLTATPSEATDE